MSWVGRSLPRLEDPTLVRGEGNYVADAARGAASVRFVRSPVASGTILGIEKPDDGIIFTAADLDGIKGIKPILHRPDYVPVEQPLLARDRVVFAGQAIAVVVAEDHAAAEDLAEQVFVDIESVDAALDVDLALKEGAPVVHEQAPGNVLVEGKVRTAGLDDALEQAAAKITIEIRSRRQAAMPLETRGGFAQYERGTGRVTLFASVQMPHMLRTGIADVLGIAEADLRVIAPDVGGGFGQKMSLFPEYVILVWLARRLKRDLAWIEDRRENLMAATHSRDQAFTVTGAFSSDGKLLGIEADMRSNVGAFSCYPVPCDVEPLMALAELPGPYAFKEYGARSRGVTTNTCMMAPYRGVSRHTLTFTMVRMMDVAAKRLGLDPVEIRRRNLVDTFPFRAQKRLNYHDGSYLATMELAVPAMDLPAFRHRQTEEWKEGRYLGFGLSVFNERTGYGTPAYAARGMDIVPGYEIVDCSMDPSGNVQVRIGSSPHGQGLKTTLAQLIADELGVAPQSVRVIAGDTDATPYGWGTFASRALVIGGGGHR